jgi:Protein of unknown function (DUF2628)
MASYIVMEPTQDRRGDAALFISDSFHFLALVFPVLWLMLNRLWYEAVMVALVSLILVGGLSYLGLAQFSGLASFLIGLSIALEGSALQILASRRRGFVDEAIIDANSLREAEESYYLARPMLIDPPAAHAEAPARGLTSTGLFALPGSH